MLAPRPRASKGERPYFLDCDSERLLTMVMALAAEVSRLSDALDSLTRVAAAKPGFSLADLVAFQPDDDVAAARAARRDAMLGRLFRIIEAEAERAADPPQPYAEIERLVADPRGGQG